MLDIQHLRQSARLGVELLEFALSLGKWPGGGEALFLGGATAGLGIPDSRFGLEHHGGGQFDLLARSGDSVVGIEPFVELGQFGVQPLEIAQKAIETKTGLADLAFERTLQRGRLGFGGGGPREFGVDIGETSGDVRGKRLSLNLPLLFAEFLGDQRLRLIGERGQMLVVLGHQRRLAGTIASDFLGAAGELGQPLAGAPLLCLGFGERDPKPLQRGGRFHGPVAEARQLMGDDRLTTHSLGLGGLSVGNGAEAVGHLCFGFLDLDHQAAHPQEGNGGLGLANVGGKIAVARRLPAPACAALQAASRSPAAHLPCA